MGRDKAALRLGSPDVDREPRPVEPTFLERTIATLGPLCGQVITVGGPRRLDDVVHFVDAAHDAGPLAGVVAALSSGLGDRYLFVSCDAPLVEQADLDLLLGAATPACFAVGTRLLPLPCVIASSGEEPARVLLAGDDRSLRSLLVALGVVAVPVDDDVAARLRGVNTPDELAAVRR